MDSFSITGFAWRIGFTLALVLLTFNPSGFSYFHWVSGNFPSFTPAQVVLGIALLLLVTTVGVPLSLVSVTIGHLLICLPFALAVLMARFEGFDASLEEASRDLGPDAMARGRLIHGEGRDALALEHGQALAAEMLAVIRRVQLAAE